MSTKNMTDAEFEAYLEEKEFDRFFEGEDEDEDSSSEDDAEGWEYEDDCPLDGDAESALASCGWGTDEDYGYFGGEEW